MCMTKASLAGLQLPYGAASCMILKGHLVPGTFENAPGNCHPALSNGGQGATLSGGAEGTSVTNHALNGITVHTCLHVCSWRMPPPYDLSSRNCNGCHLSQIYHAEDWAAEHVRITVAALCQVALPSLWACDSALLKCMAAGHAEKFLVRPAVSSSGLRVPGVFIAHVSCQ